MKKFNLNLLALLAALVSTGALAQSLPSSPTRSPPPTSPLVAPGLYVHVIDGLVNLANKGGTTSFAAGQFGYTANVTKPPVVLPANPGIKFTPPPTFLPTSASNVAAGGNKAAPIDCVVR